jgi:hypothetical protein
MRSISDIIPPLSTSYFIILCRQMRRARDERADVRDNLRNIKDVMLLFILPPPSALLIASDQVDGDQNARSDRRSSGVHETT